MAGINVLCDVTDMGNSVDASIKPCKRVVKPNKFFEYLKPNPSKPNMAYYACLLQECPASRKNNLPEPEKPISCANNSRHNARRHLKTWRATRLDEFNTECNNLDSKATEKSDCSIDLEEIGDQHVSPRGKKRKLQLTIEDSCGFESNRPRKKPLTQEEVDRIITDFIVDDTLPINTVEQPGFRRMMTRLIPQFTIRSRNTIRARLFTKFKQRTLQLKTALAQTPYVCTTTDVWTSRRRSFIGVTVHWFTEDLIRKSACLAVRRMKGSITYDVLAKTLENIHVEFGISRKITTTVTDNGSNFVKAFRIFAESMESYEEIDYEDLLERYTDEVEETNNQEEDIQFVDVASILDNPSSPEIKDNYRLPPHRRCCCHTLNLIATTDVDKITNRTFNSLMISCEKKLKSVWYKQQKSSQS